MPWHARAPAADDTMGDRLLIIEDEALLGSELERHFGREGWQVERVASLAEARGLLVDGGFDPLVVLSDMNLPDGNALDLLESVREQVRDVEWLFLTGYGTVADSVRALRLGAYDFLEKPCEQARLDLVVGGAARSARAQRRLENEALQRHALYGIETFVGSSGEAQAVRDVLRRLCEVPFSALVISGETGTGKGLATRIVHHNGRRSQGPLVEVNCAALPRELLESELFGHEPGAFTGARKRHRGLMEQADHGTLFLDEISEMDIDLQTKLLKAIEDGRLRPLGGEREVTVDVQIVAASNRNLGELVKRGDFRGDLFHRLSVFDIELPPLRKRRDDIEELLPVIVSEFNAKAGKSVRRIPDTVWTRLKEHDWPGNVRELRNVVERCVLFSDGETFPEQWLQLRPDGRAGGSETATLDGDLFAFPLDGSVSLEEIEKQVIAAVLARSGNNTTAAARLLGTTRQTLRYRIQKYGLGDADGA